jgi:FkbM family methyltransferase
MINKIFEKIKYRYYKYLFNFKKKVKKFNRISTLDYKEKLLIACDNIRELETRANSCKKEPELINWLEINRNKEKQIIWDIGSNIGAYSLVAATIGYKVLSFEPAYQNYFKLHENISLNKLDEQIEAFCISFGDKPQTGNFNIFETSFGTSKGNYNADNYYQSNLKKIFQKKTLVFSIDSFIKIFNLPEPSLIKIDVDGGELEILKGAATLLEHSKSLKSLLVEFDEDEYSINELETFLKKLNWKITSKHNRGGGVNNLIINKEK